MNLLCVSITLAGTGSFHLRRSRLRRYHGRGDRDPTTDSQSKIRSGAFKRRSEAESPEHAEHEVPRTWLSGLNGDATHQSSLETISAVDTDNTELHGSGEGLDLDTTNHPEDSLKITETDPQIDDSDFDESSSSRSPIRTHGSTNGCVCRKRDINLCIDVDVADGTGNVSSSALGGDTTNVRIQINVRRGSLSPIKSLNAEDTTSERQTVLLRNASSVDDNVKGPDACDARRQDGCVNETKVNADDIERQNNLSSIPLDNLGKENNDAEMQLTLEISHENLDKDVGDGERQNVPVIPLDNTDKDNSDTELDESDNLRVDVNVTVSDNKVTGDEEVNKRIVGNTDAIHNNSVNDEDGETCI